MFIQQCTSCHVHIVRNILYPSGTYRRVHQQNDTLAIYNIEQTKIKLHKIIDHLQELLLTLAFCLNCYFAALVRQHWLIA